MSITAPSSAASGNFTNTDPWKDIIEPVATRLLNEPNHRLSKKGNELRFGTNGSLSVNLIKGTFFDHEAGQGGGVIDLVIHVLGCDRGAAIDWLRRERFLEDRPQPKPAHQISVIERCYDYHDQDGN